MVNFLGVDGKKGNKHEESEVRFGVEAEVQTRKLHTGMGSCCSRPFKSLPGVMSGPMASLI